MLPDLAALRRRLSAGPIDARTALAEAAVLYRAVTPPSGGREPRGSAIGVLAEPETLTSFDTADAAHRFAGAVRQGTGVAARVDSRVLGIRHRHEMHFVLAAPENHTAVLGALSGGWRGATAAVSMAPVGLGTPASRRAPATAAAIWRGLLLTTTPVRNAAGLRLRIRDTDLLALAVRSAQTLGVVTRARATSGLGILCVEEQESVNRLLERLLPRIPGQRRGATTRPAGTTRPLAPGRRLTAVR
ncbi:hypothetical protein [Actinocatenispora rupis]|uniref:Uncharacterized protein n=1 Tax=Actinocatenispora rupis TaxID=519421 RepID=A0A8J3NFC2_9ACTN|nr:hypothetical protein [Actinocatenispora rupis]GID14735.1 hypothetical protein Aru02nite_56240 [Actinocatenispora rupis]